MTAIFIKELQSFFHSSTGYLILFIFLTMNGLFLWVFPGAFNILDSGFADLSNFFLLAPWVFLFLIPAITMRSFSEEKKLGTLELLLIKPISKEKLVLAKFLGAFMLCVLALLPTLLYIVAISELGITRGNIDLGVVMGSYFGTLFLIALYTAIGIFCSTLSPNQIFAFILGGLLCFLLLYLPDMLAGLFPDGTTQQSIKTFGARIHFDSIGKGILDTRDMVYFLSLTLFFLYLAMLWIKNSGEK